MTSNRAANPAKLFIGILTSEDVRLEERLVERLISEFGPSDHRVSLIPTEGTIHRVFLSFDRLIETGNLAEIRKRSKSIEDEFPVKLTVGFLDNRRTAEATATPGSEPGKVPQEKEMIQFKNGGTHFFSWTHPDYMSGKSQDFFLAMRKTFRSQLRNMCLLRR